MEGFNPCRPHSLRAAFKSKLINKISDELIDFWMGHELGSTKDAYLNMPTEELCELYMDAEKHLAIERTSRDELTELEKGKFEISADIEQKIKGLETTVSTLQQKLGKQEATIKNLTENFTKNVEVVAQDLFNRLFEEDRKETIREQKLREEKAKEVHPLKLKQKIVKPIKIEKTTEEEPKPSPKQKKRPLTWREEILGEGN